MASEGRTRVVVTNMLDTGTLSKADSVIWLDHGRIRYNGPFNGLIAADEEEDGFASFLAQEKAKMSPESPSSSFESSRTPDVSAIATLDSKKALAGRDVVDPDIGRDDRGIVDSSRGERIAEIPADSADDGSGALVIVEDRKTGIVERDVYWRLCEAAQLRWVIFSFGAFLASQFVAIGRDWFLAYWTTQNNVGNQDTAIFLPVFMGLTILFVAMTLCRSTLLVNVGLNCSIALHAECIRAVIYSPLSYFDVTPTGRILNRFAKVPPFLTYAFPVPSFYTFLSSTFLLSFLPL